MQVLFMLIMALFHCVWVSCLGVCQMYQVAVLAMTTNERMNAARYRHFQSGIASYALEKVNDILQVGVGFITLPLTGDGGRTLLISLVGGWGAS